MLEAYDRDRTAKLLKEAHDITIALKAEIREIATQMRHVLDGGEEGAHGIEGHAPDVENRGDVALPTATVREPPTARSFWQFWR